MINIQLYTSNFAHAAKEPKAVAISRGKPWFFRGRSYPALAPSAESLAKAKGATPDPADFDREFRAQLALLDPAQVATELGDGALLLCWEGFNVRCHRRLVAEWLEEKLGIVVPELGHARADSIPYSAQLAKAVKPKVLKPGKQLSMISLLGWL
jgi:hypothetical protein